MKRCSTLLIVREMQSKLTVRYQLTQIRMAIMKISINNKAGENVDKKEPSHTVGGEVNWYSTMDNSMDFFKKKLGKKPPYKPAIPLLGIYWENHNSKRHVCSHVYSALFTTARMWKQPRCPLTDEWIKSCESEHIFHSVMSDSLQLHGL